MRVELNLSDFETTALKRVAKEHNVSMEDMALAYIRDGLRIENAPKFSRRRWHRDNDLTFEPLADYDPHPNPRY